MNAEYDEMTGRAVALPRPVSRIKGPRWLARPIECVSDAARKLGTLAAALMMLLPAPVLALPVSGSLEEFTVPDGHIKSTLSALANTARPLLSLPADSAPWLSEVYSFVESGDRELAVDLLFERVDELLADDRMAECDALLQLIDVTKLDSHLMVSSLSITWLAREHLPSRTSLVARIEAQLIEREPTRVGKLLARLR